MDQLAGSHIPDAWSIHRAALYVSGESDPAGVRSSPGALVSIKTRHVERIYNAWLDLKVLPCDAKYKYLRGKNKKHSDTWTAENDKYLKDTVDLCPVLFLDEIKKKLTERIYEYWKNLSPNTKTTICVISGTAGGVIALGLIISWGNIETLRGGVSPQLIHRPPSKLISSGLNSRFCREVLAYTLTKVNLPENFVIPDKIDTILLDSTIENLNQLLESNQEIKFINTSVLFELLKMCEKFFTDD